MDISLSSLFAGLVFSTFGFYFFKLGKKTMDFKLMGISVLLFIFPYFISNPWVQWPLGGALMGLAYVLRGNSFY